MLNKPITCNKILSSMLSKKDPNLANVLNRVCAIFVNTTAMELSNDAVLKDLNLSETQVKKTNKPKGETIV